MTNRNDAPRACPFCGDEAFVKREHGRTFVACVSSPRTCPVSPKVASYGDDEAIAAWNRRPSPVAGGDLREVDDCPFCGSTDIAYLKTSDKAHPYQIRCKSCGNGTAHHGDWKAATRAWTRRAALNQPAAPVEATGYLVNGRYHPLDRFRGVTVSEGDEVTALYAHPPEPAASTVAAAVGGQVCGFCQGNWCARGLCPECGSPEIVAARAAAKQGQSEPFAREDRFIVVKRKHLTTFEEGAIRNQLAALGVPTVECVVVESDWPEYETVWRMIEDRVTGGG